MKSILTDIATLESAAHAAAEAHAAAVEQLARYESQLAGVKATVEQHRAAKDAHDAWRLEAAELGREPSVPVLAEAPVAPAQPRPSDGDVLAARSVLDEAQRAEGAAAQRKRDLKAAVATAESSARAAAVAEAEAGRMDALVAALRRAPTEIARRQAEALGDMGPVQFRFPEEGPAVEVLIAGRPWWQASTGERIHADLCIRAGWRRLLGMPWLPLFADEIQSWSGEWPDVAGPVIGIRTTKAAALRVVPFGAALTDEDLGLGERGA